MERRIRRLSRQPRRRLDLVRDQRNTDGPADKDDEWAGRLWLQARARFDAWIDGVMSELRAGRQSALDDDVRPRTAPGGEWGRYVSPRFNDD